MSVRPVKRTRTKKDGTTRVVPLWEVDVRFVECGKPAKHRDFFHTLREAKAKERALLMQIASGIFGVETKLTPTIADFAPRFMQWSTQANKPSTVAAKEVALRAHVLPALGHLRLDAVDLRAEVEAFVTTKLAEELSAKTVKNLLAVLDKLLHLAAERGLVQHVPKLQKPRTVTPEMDHLDLVEAQSVLDAVDPRWRTLLLVALRTGLRAGELLALKWPCVDFGNGQVRVHLTRWRKLEHSPKGNRERVIPLSGDAVAALKTHRHLRGQYVFCHEDGSPYTHSEWKNVVPRACAAAGVKRVTLHGLRHSFGAHLIMRRRSLLEVKEALGHADYKTTLRYAHWRRARSGTLYPAPL